MHGQKLCGPGDVRGGALRAGKGCRKRKRTLGTTQGVLRLGERGATVEPHGWFVFVLRGLMMSRRFDQSADDGGAELPRSTDHLDPGLDPRSRSVARANVYLTSDWLQTD